MPKSDIASLEAADVAIIGVPWGVPYGMEGSRSPASAAPQAIRAQSLRLSRYLTHYDYDFGGDIFAGRQVRIVDCGDVAMMPGRYEENQRAVTDAIRGILDRGAVPFVLGGDHSIPIPVMRAYDACGPLGVVQIDAHLDWRDEIGGVRDGLSSPMRRASELPWVAGMTQIGIRGVGSARQTEIDAARAYGSELIGAAELHRTGVAAALARIPDADRYYITFDADGLDPAIAPGVSAMAFGGLTYYEATDLLRGVAAKGKIVGFDFVEVVPGLDSGSMTAFLAARLILNMLGALAHTGQIGSPTSG
jgi:agmatinase